MEVINAFHIDKKKEGRKNKQRATKVEATRVDTQ